MLAHWAAGSPRLRARAWIQVVREAIGPEGRVVPQQWLAKTTAPGIVAGGLTLSFTVLPHAARRDPRVPCPTRWQPHSGSARAGWGRTVVGTTPEARPLPRACSRGSPHTRDQRAHRRAVHGAEAQPDQRRFPRPGLRSLAYVGKMLHAARLAAQHWSLLSLRGAHGLQDALRDLRGARSRTTGSASHGGLRTAKAKSPKPRRRELGCTCGVFRQRGVRTAEKPGQARRDSGVVTSGVFFAERGGQHAQQVICLGAAQ